MSGPRSEQTSNLLLIAATTTLILTAQRYFQANTHRRSQPQFAHPVVARRGSLGRERSQPGHGRLSSNPFRIPWAGWKDILWRTYVRTAENRLLATAAGVVFFGLLGYWPVLTISGLF